MKSIHSYFKLKGGKLKTSIIPIPGFARGFLLACFFFSGAGGWASGFWAGWGLLILISSVAAKVALRPHAL